MKKLILIFCLIPTTILLAAQSPRGAETFAIGAPTTVSVSLRWTHAAPAGTHKFRVYLRRNGTNYSGFSDAGTNMTLRITGLQRKTTYKCYVTAYVVSGQQTLESQRSTELTFRTGNNANEPPEEL